MSHYLYRTNRSELPRNQRFSYQFGDDITTLLRLIIRDLLDRQHHVQRNGIDGKHHATQLNNSLAFFIHDCLSIMDRGFVFSLIKIYCKEVPKNLSTTRFIFIFFLRNSSIWKLVTVN